MHLFFFLLFQARSKAVNQTLLNKIAGKSGSQYNEVNFITLLNPSAGLTMTRSEQSEQIYRCKSDIKVCSDKRKSESAF